MSYAQRWNNKKKLKFSRSIKGKNRALTVCPSDQVSEAHLKTTCMPIKTIHAVKIQRTTTIFTKKS